VAKNPADPVVVPVLAEQRTAAGDADGAIALYEGLLAVNPANTIALNNLAMLYIAKGSDKALALAERAYKSAPEAAAVQDTYGWVLFRSGQTDKGLELLRKAAQSLGNNAEVQYHLGAALASAGKDAEAAEWLKKAVAGQLPADQKADAQKLLDQVGK
jgi:Flp pilus assembly protein TadD